MTGNASFVRRQMLGTSNFGLNTMLDEIPFSAFEDLERRIMVRGASNLLRLHQGKTTFPPCVHSLPAPAPAFTLQAHEHAPPGGVPALRQRIADHLESRGRQVSYQDVLVSCGSTQAISMALHCILQPTDEVLVLSPQWLFAVGLVAGAGGRAVEVPVFLELGREPTFDFIAALKRYTGPRTRAIYFNTPNNPTGYSMSHDDLSRLAVFAAQHDLWIISDNAYENYDYSQSDFVEISSCREAANRTFSVYTFSKTYAMPGYRVGYVVSPPGLVARLRKWSLYSIYSLSTAAQMAAFYALSTDAAELGRRKSLARAARDLVASRLAIPSTDVSGGLYAFLDLSSWRQGDVDAFLDETVKEGVTVAPGAAFGRHCRQFVRLCFTAVAQEDLSLAIDRLNRVYCAR